MTGGIRVVEKLEFEYEFSEKVLIVDGGVLGIIARARSLVVVDTVLNNSNPGDLHRLEDLTQNVLDEIKTLGGSFWPRA